MNKPGQPAGIHCGLASRAGRAQAAFTLLEIIVAVGILTTIGVAFYGGLASGGFLVQTTREDLRATQILMQKTEAIRLCTWGELLNINFQEPYDPLGATNGSGGVRYYGTVKFGPATAVPNSADYFGRMRLVTVDLSWTNYLGAKTVAHHRQMQTQVARYGMQNYIWGAIH